jgi:membrane peptidoglycan carboxypeptidase
VTGTGQALPLGRSAQRRKKSLRWRRVRRTLYSLVALGLIGPIIAFMVAYIFTKVPQPSDVQTNQVATVFNADGSQLARIVPPEGNRTDVTIADIPTHVRFAVLSAEDRSFYSNPGFSVTGTARAALNDLSGGDRQGGSTITQQYVKNALTGDDQTLSRKLRELVISSKLSRQTSKDDILAAYLNTIYFGRGAYGIAAASKAYFGKATKDLTVAEGAVLASSIRSPTALDPTSHLEIAQERWTFVLDGMVSQNWLTPADRAAQVYPTVSAPKPADVSAGTQGANGLIVRQVQAELEALQISPQQLNTEGLQITTTIDPKTQSAAVDAAKKTLADQPQNLRTAVVSVDPRTGGVRAYYGGDDGNGFDRAQATSLPPGSTFKVFDLATALKQGTPLNKTYDGSSPQTISGQKISNSDGEDGCGTTCSLSEALKESLNTVYYRLTTEIGSQAVADTAHAAGIPLEFPGGQKTLVELNPSGPPNAGIGLGAYPVRPIDMAASYATLAANGVQRDAHFVQKVVTADGTVLFDRGSLAGKQAIDEPIAQNVTAAMQPIAAASRGHGLAGGRLSAAKTGTNQFLATADNRDAWMVGFTPSLSTAVWVGTDNPEPIKTKSGGPIYGSGLPSDIWKSTMDGALQGTPKETFPKAPAINGATETTTPAPTRRTTTSTAPTTTTTSGAPTATTTETPTTTPTTTTKGSKPTKPTQTTTAPAPVPCGPFPGFPVGCVPTG